MSNERDELAHIIWTTSRQDEGTISAAGAESVANALIAAGYQKQQVDTSNEANLAAVIVALDPFERVTKWMATDDEVGRYAVEAVQKIRSILGGGTKVIPAQAVEAAAMAIWEPNERDDEWVGEYETYKDYLRAQATKVLEAAAPHIIAGHFRDMNLKAIANEIENPPNFSKGAP